MEEWAKYIIKEFDKTESFLKNQRWGFDRCDKGQLDIAFQWAQSFGTEGESYTPIWKAIEDMGLIKSDYSQNIQPKEKKTLPIFSFRCSFRLYHVSYGVSRSVLLSRHVQISIIQVSEEKHLLEAGKLIRSPKIIPYSQRFDLNRASRNLQKGKYCKIHSQK